MRPRFSGRQKAESRRPFNGLGHVLFENPSMSVKDSPEAMPSALAFCSPLKYPEMEYVYAVPTVLLPAPSSQLQPVTPELYALLSTRGVFLPRDEAEQDETHRQVIPYVITEHDGQMLVMHRTKAGGDQRLHLKYTLGVGGHINPIDGADDPIQAGLQRELEEEIEANITHLELLGMILMDDTPVSRVHVGLLYRAQSENAPLVRETEKLHGEMRSRQQIRDLFDALESWSQLAFEAM